MPDIQLIGFSRADSVSEMNNIRRLLRGFPQADQLNLVWFESRSEGLADGKSAPFVRLQGRQVALADFEFDLIAKLNGDYAIEVAHNHRWFPRRK